MFVGAFSLTMYAQTYKLGDLIEKDGIKAVVAYVDESGQHGFMISPCAYLGDECFEEKGTKPNYETFKEETRKYFESQQKFIAGIVKGKIKKQCKQTGEDPKEVYEKLMNSLRDTLEMQLELIDMMSKMPRLTCPVKHKDKEWNEMYQNILSFNSEYGKENTQAILDYCIKNDISMQDWFPAYYWVTQLGNDWFIPGAHELELFGLQFVDKLGAGLKNSTMKMDKLKEHAAIYDNYKYHWRFLKCVYPNFSYGVPMLIGSSTLSKSTWAENKENKDKITFNSGNGSLVGVIGGAIDKDVNIRPLTFVCDLTNCFFATGISEDIGVKEGTMSGGTYYVPVRYKYYAMAEF